MNDWRDALSDDARKALACKPMPDWMPPMLATLTDDHFSSPEWIFERKLDGQRCLIFRRKSRLHILSRNQPDLNGTYPELIDALVDQPQQHFIADGEIVAFEGNLTSFSRLQGRMGISNPDAARESGIKVYLYLFDVLYLDSYDTTALPLRSRKKLLRGNFSFSDPLRYTSHRNTSGEAFYESACSKGWEGLIAKRADSAYQHSRSRQWLKFKCINQQELVIGGYTEPKGSRSGFGALLLGYYADGELRYAGKVGTGFNEQTLNDLGQQLKAETRKDSPYAGEQVAAAGRGVHWVEPKRVAEIGFTEWTGAGRLRHPRFLGLRHDKNANEVVREEPE